MNKEWSELNKTMQLQLKKEETYNSGKETLFNLREQLMGVLLSLKSELIREDFYAMPFINAEGYHSKSIAYSVWHIFRIEDIVAHTLINNDEQVFFKDGYKERINSPIITTGNELVKDEIAAFSKKLDIDELYSYAAAVKSSTEIIVNALTFKSLKNKIPNELKEKLVDMNVVDKGENSAWLIDYWCGKDIRGLIQMPFSRHWIMHIEACLRIKNKLNK
ncbi:hypothetical protein [Ruminococcus flavefaciens]|uniref:Phage head-tail adapter protein n=1 Tax=Ruminococcus flavefaciens 007c TaxID=1341157 RepID=W7UQP5_RUMFL|nr:hypothetical protein [Ruminococcus flavefaciens]EWM53754.1 hypothetical protein RF007C_06745 [Ruminococcus flavefaciens 007c]